MKKLVSLAVLALLSANVFAQSEDLYLYQSSDEVFTMETLSHWAYGDHFITTDSFKPSNGGEFFFNILKIKFYPVEYAGLEISADLRFDHFASKEDGFRLDSGNKVQAFKMAGEFGGDIKKVRGWMHVNSFSFPAIIKLGGDKFKIGAGAEAVVPYRATANYKYKLDGEKHKNKTKGMEVNKFFYDIVGVVNINDLSIYGKYYPKGSTLLPDGSAVDMSFWTLGVGFDF